MSDTPRTQNAQVAGLGKPWWNAYPILLNHSEELERENAALRAALSEIKAYSVGWKEEVARKALDAARKEQS